MAKPQYRLTVGKGGSIYRGNAETISTDLDDWLNETLGRRLSGEVDWREYQRRLTTALTTLYAEGITTVVRDWIGALSQGTGVKLNPSDPLNDSERMEGIVDKFDANWEFVERSKRFNGGLKNAFAMAGNDSLTWHPLTKYTMQKKAKLLRGKGGKLKLSKTERDGVAMTSKARAMFKLTGELRGELMAKRRAMVKKTGVVRVAGINLRVGKKAVKLTKVRGQKLPIAKLRVRLLPNVALGNLPGFRSGDWTEDTYDMSFEQSLGLSPATIRKLGNRRGDESLGKRPMLQPIFTYYTLFRAPQVIGAVADNMLAQATRDMSRRFNGAME